VVFPYLYLKVATGSAYPGTGNAQIPLDEHGPDETRPDKCSRLGSPTRSLTCLVLAKFHYRGPDQTLS